MKPARSVRIADEPATRRRPARALPELPDGAGRQRFEPGSRPSSQRDRPVEPAGLRRPGHHRREHRQRPPRAVAQRHGRGETPSPVVRPDRPTPTRDPLPDRRRDRPRRHGRRPQGPRPRPRPRRRDQGPASDLRDNADLVRRFVEEAQIGGQLQHPGVVPIYELGTFADRRPFFSMKLVKGQTLADLLAARSGPADDLPRLLSIFAAIAQTMAYSHTRGVIHRDLKPSNVMVGSFGEVQVMDWGLARSCREAVSPPTRRRARSRPRRP